MARHEPRFPIGLQFDYRDRKGRRTVVDILTTTTAADEVVKIEYVTERSFIGQPIRETFTDASIARSLPAEQLRRYL